MGREDQVCEPEAHFTLGSSYSLDRRDAPSHDRPILLVAGPSRKLSYGRAAHFLGLECCAFPYRLAASLAIDRPSTGGPVSRVRSRNEPDYVAWNPTL